jgi:hypothetical protein
MSYSYFELFDFNAIGCRGERFKVKRQVMARDIQQAQRLTGGYFHCSNKGEEVFSHIAIDPGGKVWGITSDSRVLLQKDVFFVRGF